MTLTKSFIQTAATTPRDARLMLMSLIVTDASGNPRTGVLGQGTGNIVTATGGMTVNVAAAEFVTSRTKLDGVSILTNDGVVSVPITAAPVSNSRIDVVWVKHNDDTQGDANSLPVFGVTDGTPGAIPTPNAIPTGATELAQVRIYAGTTATNGGTNTVTQTYQNTATRGSAVPFRNKAALDLWTTAAVGQEAVTTDTGERWSKVAAGWLLTFRPLLAWAPTTAGLTLGNGILRAFYSKRDKVIDAFFELESGSTTLATATLSFTLPEAIADASMHRHIGEGYLNYAGTVSGSWPAQARLTGSATVVNINLLDASGGLVTPGLNVSNTFPTSAAWNGTGYRPTIYLHLTYRTAA